MGTEKLGLGEVLHPDLPSFIARYRFFFNPIRYTSFGLAVCEAMMIGLPIAGMATTEMPAVFTNGVNGIVHNDIDHLIFQMKKMINDRSYAREIGERGRETVRSRFNIQRFTRDWELIFRSLIKREVYEERDSIYQ
jgi:glycosyltransferase involved in cell wall biosynthesis